ncbi:GNAT family N-acetyltransferase [Pseudotabrizicola sp. 4114]|uniref:GNAT family N-acetyltransferase n=1 Tax=Pseudotabrizicola sp. 4114 TaxID=2817731 RepID=UPI0028608DBA|nr:GNAT superfamily N-acetyltransferase [Pseudorhodobacter sp. 4114]
METLVRRGTEADAHSAIDTIRRSISELCVADYEDDPQRLTNWLRNKTEATWMAWIDRPDAAVFVAELKDRIAGVGMVDQLGNVLLNYVHPDARFCGVSKAVLAALESEARMHHAQRCLLESTKTARAFYERRGYQPLAGSATHLWKAL